MRLEFSFAFIPFIKEPIQEKHFQFVKDIGCKYIELPAITKPLFDVENDSQVRFVQSCLKKFGLEVNSVHCSVLGPHYLAARNSVQAQDSVFREIKLLSLLGGKYYTLHDSVFFTNPDTLIIDKNGKPYPHDSLMRDLRAKPETTKKKIRQALYPMAEFAREHKVTITLENDCTEPDCSDYLLEIIEGIDPQICAICLDVGHAQLESNAVRVARLMGSRVVNAHIHDNHGEEDEHLLPFEGIIDFPGVIRVLKEIGYTGVLTYESYCKQVSKYRKNISKIRSLWEIS